jgi:hypothetical protein
LQPKVPRDLETVCLKCLQKEPARRYGRAGELAADLRRFQEGKPILARPVGRVEKAAKWARRRPAVAGLASLLGLVSLAGFAGVSWQWGRAQGEGQKAVESAAAERRTAYARGISMAFDEWRAGNAGSAESLLDRCPTDLRDWEWHYLRRLFRVRRLATLEGHAAGVLAVAFSPDGGHVASAGADGLVKVWDRGSLREVLTAS